MCFVISAVMGSVSSSATRSQGSESAALRREDKTVTVTPRFSAVSVFLIWYYMHIRAAHYND